MVHRNLFKTLSKGGNGRDGILLPVAVEIAMMATSRARVFSESNRLTAY